MKLIYSRAQTRRPLKVTKSPPTIVVTTKISSGIARFTTRIAFRRVRKTKKLESMRKKKMESMGNKLMDWARNNTMDSVGKNKTLLKS